MTERNWTISDQLPDEQFPEFGEPVPRALIGAKVLALGALAHWSGKEYAALGIEFLPEGSTQATRLVLAFREGKMWILPNPLVASYLVESQELCFVTPSQDERD